MGNMCFRLRTKNMRKDLEFPILREAAYKKAYNEGYKKGLEKACMEKGMESGKTEGKMEGLRIAARNMKQLGLSFADISKATGLPEQEIANL